MAQTNYSPGLLPSLPGMLADINPLVTESGYNSESASEAALALLSESTRSPTGRSC